ncbi:transposase [Candidatus Pacearchaeota archaeon]|nr:transposase [Candidatus Pacearchaeota archaeon]
METQAVLPVETKYSQNWHKYNLAKTHEKRMFYQLLHELCQIIPEPDYKFGRPPIPIKDMIFCLGLKLYSNYSGRKVMSDLVHAERANYIMKSPHFNTLTDFLACDITYDLLQKILTISAMPLKELEDQFSIDSSGFGSYQYERWQRVRFSRSYEVSSRNYLKGHVCIGTRTNVIVSAEATYGNLSDVKQAPALLEKVGKNFNIKEVSADKAYNAHRIFEIIEEMNAKPFIAFKSNANPGKDSPEIWKRMYDYFVLNRESFMKHYHKRSNVETTFAMIKLRLGEFLKCKNYTSQRNELLMKFICHNITCLVQEIFESDVHVDFRECMKKYVEVKI